MVEVIRAPYLDVRIPTRRLVLRPITAADVPALATHLADLEVTRWLARVPHPYGLTEARAFVDHVRLAAVAGTAVTLALVPKSAGEAEPAIGVVAIHGLDAGPEFGYWLGKTWWGQGLMTEAVQSALAWIFAHLRVDDIASGAFVGNDASLRIQSRFGFQVVGRSRRECQALGRDLEHVDTRLTRNSFLVGP
ncbi:GNAT family N-acetyltransferase [Chthonobacter albigriseus]|uniref:GNAT family N-acetyltransferase n=1 Tax=Chthonobacter albigriseus TaxID=1683161 RepID=UPI0015EFD1F2